MNKATTESLGFGVTDITSSAYVTNPEFDDKSNNKIDMQINRSQDKHFNRSHFGFVNGGIDKKDANMIEDNTNINDRAKDSVENESGRYFTQVFKKDDWGLDLDPRHIRLNRYTYKIESDKKRQRSY